MNRDKQTIQTSYTSPLAAGYMPVIVEVPQPAWADSHAGQKFDVSELVGFDESSGSFEETDHSDTQNSEGAPFIAPIADDQLPSSQLLDCLRQQVLGAPDAAINNYLTAVQYAADDLDHFHRGELKERESVSAIWSRLRVHTDPFKELRVTGGDVRLSCIETQLDDFRKSMMQRAKTSHKRRRPDDDDLVLRSREQRIFHTAYVNTCLPHIYGTEWATSSIRVLKRRRVDELSIGTLVRAPRRFGKSWAVGQFNAVILIYCPGLTIAIFARTKRQTGWLAGITVRFIMMAGKGGRILKYSGETLFVGIKDKWEYHKIASLVPDNERSRLDYYPDGTSGTCFFTSSFPAKGPTTNRALGLEETCAVPLQMQQPEMRRRQRTRRSRTLRRLGQQRWRVFLPVLDQLATAGLPRRIPWKKGMCTAVKSGIV